MCKGCSKCIVFEKDREYVEVLFVLRLVIDKLTAEIFGKK